MLFVTLTKQKYLLTNQICNNFKKNLYNKVNTMYKNDFANQYINMYIRRVEGAKIKATELKAHYDSVVENKLHIRELIRVMDINGFSISTISGYKYFRNIEIIKNERGLSHPLGDKSLKQLF